MTISIFLIFVLLSGWGAGFLLARNVQKHGKPTFVGIATSLFAVAVPTAMAFILTSTSERFALFDQFYTFPIDYLVFAVVGPFLIAFAGHFGSVRSCKGIDFVPGKIAWSKAFQMLPLLLIWGLLEEIGWRGFLVPKLLAQSSPLLASTAAGLAWGLWHVPQVFLNPTFKQSLKGRLMLGAVLWTLQCIILGTLLGLLQIRTGTFLIPTIAHALVNFFGSVFESESGAEKNHIVGGTSGLYAIAASSCLLVLWTMVD